MTAICKAEFAKPLRASILALTLILFPVSAFAQTVTPQGEHLMPQQAGPSLPQAQPEAPSIGPKSQGMGAMDMSAPANNAPPPQTTKKVSASDGAGSSQAMPMGSMQGGKAPADARDTNAFSDGYDYGTMPGMEQADKIRTNSLLGDQLEFTHGREGDGFAWDIHDAYGPDEWKLLLRTEGAVVGNKVDVTTGAEALWWRPLTAFWGTTLGVHQDFGPGSHTSLAFGVEGLAPYWVQVEATGYVD